jgi:APA family basic amino acid/polyamine antiporter
MSSQPPGSTSGLFLRQSSGLVKSAGLIDVFIFNVGLVSVGIGLAYTQRFGPAYYPNGSIIRATIGATVLMLFVTLGFWAWTITIPRSGGIYVFLTRSRLSGIGFALSFVESISWLFYVAIAATLIVSAGVWPLAALLLGPHATTAEWLTTSLAKLIVGSAIIWIAAFLLVRGTQIYFRVQKMMFLLAIAGTLALLYVLANPNALAIFEANANSVFGIGAINAYQEMQKQAVALGQTVPGPTEQVQTIALIVWPFLPLIGSAFSLVLGGETQNNARNQIAGMLGSLLFCAVIFIVVAHLSDLSLGTRFQGAIAYVFDNGKDANPSLVIPGEPYLVYLAGLATDQPLLRTLIAVGFIAWIWFWIPGVLAYTERVFLAWSLDRSAPAFLAELHPIWATPYLAVVTGALIAEVFLILIVYTEFFATLIFILAGATAWCVALIIGTVFPLLNSKIYELSPLYTIKVLGLPIMSILCAIGALALAFVIYLLWNDPVAAGHSVKSLTAIGLTFALGFVAYVVTHFIRKRQGINIAEAFKEIPVE